MRRNYSPFNGKQFLLNKNTNEIHDLDRETDYCKIDEIKPEHIEMFNTSLEAFIHQSINTGKSNSCYWCFPEKNNG